MGGCTAIVYVQRLTGERRAALCLVGLSLCEPAVTIGVLIMFWIADVPGSDWAPPLPAAGALVLLLPLADGRRLQESTARAASRGAFLWLLLRWGWLGVLASGVFGAFVLIEIAAGALMLAASPPGSAPLSWAPRRASPILAPSRAHPPLLALAGFPADPPAPATA